MVWEALQLHSLPSPHPWPGKKRYSSTTEHDTGAHCGLAGCANTFGVQTFLNREVFKKTKRLGGGVGCTPVNDPIMLRHIEENTRG